MAGGTVGIPVAATDLNADDPAVNDPLAYSLTGTDAASFTIHAEQRADQSGAGVTLDYEGKRTYRFTVQVTDGRDQHGDDDMDAIDDTINVVVTVTDVNEAPVVTRRRSSPSIAGEREHPPSQPTPAPTRNVTRSPGRWTTSDFWISHRGELYFALAAQLRGTPLTFTYRGDRYRHRRRRPFGLPVWDVAHDRQRDRRGGRRDDRHHPAARLGRMCKRSSAPTLTDGDGTRSQHHFLAMGAVNQPLQLGQTSQAQGPPPMQPLPTMSANYLRATAAYTDKSARSNKTASTVLTAPDRRSQARRRMRRTRVHGNNDGYAAPIRSAVPAAGRSVGPPVKSGPSDDDEGDVLTHSLSGAGRTHSTSIQPPVSSRRRPYSIPRREAKSTPSRSSVHDGFDDNYDP